MDNRTKQGQRNGHLCREGSILQWLCCRCGTITWGSNSKEMEDQEKAIGSSVTFTHSNHNF